jgi:hypothetical protein
MWELFLPHHVCVSVSVCVDACVRVCVCVCVCVCVYRPPPWSSDQSSWLQIQTSRFDSRRYQIFRVVVGPDRGPLSLVTTIEELLGRKKVAAQV